MSRPSPTAAIEAAVRRRMVDHAGAGRPAPDVRQLVLDEAPQLGPDELDRLERAVVSSLTGLGPLDALLSDPDVTDVLVNGGGDVWVDRSGRLAPTGVTLEPPVVWAIIERIFRPLGIPVDRAHPHADGLLPGGSRVTVVLPPVSADGPVLAIRRFRAVQLPLEAFGPPAVTAILGGVVEDRDDVIVFGATGSGKTTLVNAMASLAGRTDRLVVIEDVPELRITGQQVVRLQVRPPTDDGTAGRSMADLVRLALRLRPDRIVVGEVRGPEAHDMVWALATGHSGSFSTVHASSATGAMDRLRTFVSMGGRGSEATVRAQVDAAVDVVVGLRRGPGGRRLVDTVSRVGDDGSIAQVYP